MSGKQVVAGIEWVRLWASTRPLTLLEVGQPGARFYAKRLPIMSSPIDVKVCYYPESDGKPMGETDVHRDEIRRHIELLKQYYADQKVYVSGDLLVYYEQGNPKKFVVPDVFVAKGVSMRQRRIYKIWEHRHVPDVVIEATSRKTKKKDQHDKPALYKQWGVKEYFLFDPLGEYLDPNLQGYRLVNGEMVAIVPDANEALVSEVLQLRLQTEDTSLQFYRLDNGQRLLTAAEQLEEHRVDLQRETEARKRETAARTAAEAEVLRLRAELAKRDHR